MSDPDPTRNSPYSSQPPRSLGSVLVIGGNGFLGTHVIDQLLNFPSESPNNSSLSIRPPTNTPLSLGPNSSRYTYSYPPLSARYPRYDPATTKIHALDLRCSKNRLPGCTYHEADITDRAAILAVFQKVKPDLLINTASPSWESSRAILRKVNIDGTRILLDVAKDGSAWGGKCKAFVHTSSSSVIHDAQSDLRYADERWPYVVPNELEYYSETKAIAEKMVLDANDADFLTAAVRPAGIIGEMDQGGITYGILKTAQTAPGWQLNLQIGSGENLFDLTYVGNVALGLLLVADALLQTSKRKSEGKADVLDHERIDGEAFIVTNDAPGYFWESARWLYSRYGRDKDIGEKPWVLPEAFAGLIGGASELVGWVTGRKGKMNRQSVKYSCISRYYSCEKLKRRVKYVPVIDVEEGLVRSVWWFKEWEKREAEKNSSGKKGQ